MLIHDRRRCRPMPGTAIRAQLNTHQLVKLGELERQGWQLRFVRRPHGAAILARTDNSHAVLERDGRLLEADATELLVRA